MWSWAPAILPLFKMVKKIAQSCRCSGLSRWEEAIAKSWLYATFVKTVTATRSLERMFPIHALYRLITGAAIQPTLQLRVPLRYITLHNTIYNGARSMPANVQNQKFTSKWLLAVFDSKWGDFATNRQRDKYVASICKNVNVEKMQNVTSLWKNSCICIAAKWAEQHASSHATSPFYWTLLLPSSPLSHLLLLLPFLPLFCSYFGQFSFFCSFVSFLKPCKPIFVGVCYC